MKSRNQVKVKLSRLTKENNRLSDMILTIQMKDRHNSKDHAELSELRRQLWRLHNPVKPVKHTQHITTLPLCTPEGLLCRARVNGVTIQFTTIKEMIVVGMTNNKQGATV